MRRLRKRMLCVCLAAVMTLGGCGSPEKDDDLHTFVPEHYIGIDPPTLFNTKPIVDAYKNGDSSRLSELEKTILERARQIIDEQTTPDMTDYEKELAIHDHLTLICEYDMGSRAVIPDPAEHCDDPYGVLVNGKAICEGYSSTFRMFMEMIGIPCETVYSEDKDNEAHAWNIVTLDGSPYYVDLTWDDPIPDGAAGLVIHTFFNVSADLMRRERILPNSCPETRVYTESYTQHELLPERIGDPTELAGAIADAAAKNANSVCFIPADMEEWEEHLIANDDMYYSPDAVLSDGIKNACEEAGCRLVRRIHFAETDFGKALVIQFAKGD